ncbi:RIP metalloprotease RseP [Planctomicrobium piriforme]|uniref:Regulator of sigma E protease n=1 Tax=Planctomicrobium piriforme TaxID=1576369 RepID=A0A1I3QV19_9PLAN|nr:RIP metalloprotease RseP [Planctomicrobium piriforme]SFJ36947.1 regulator of sigma E protease [Planctomicrobium piriforme]
MDFVNVTLSALRIPDPLTVLFVAIGLGLVIFFHELGHFLVAKWCGVYVERFSIGFGAPILSWKWGETEYALGWLPFGGYVKMLGQDDMDPAQMTDDHVAENPRSYTAKNVPQRMAIISAGVIMNIITGTLFFVLVFTWGIMKVDRVAGYVQVGMPAWRNGIRSGDTITSINGGAVDDFDDITRRTTLSRGPIHITGHHEDGQTFDMTLTPEISGIRKIIGIGPAHSLTVIEPTDQAGITPTVPGTAAATADIKFGDKITAVSGQTVKDAQELLSVLNKKAGDAVDFEITRLDSDQKPKTLSVTVPAEPFVELGVKMGMGKIVAMRKDSIAEKAGLKAGDRIAKVNGQDVGVDLDPFRLTETFSKNAGQPVTVTVRRETEGEPETLELTMVPEDRGAWSEPPIAEFSPISIPSIGVAYHLVPTVLSVTEGSPAAEKVNPRDTIISMKLIPEPGAPKDSLGDQPQSILIGEKNWAYAFWMLQEYGRTRSVQLTVKPATADPEHTVDITPAPSKDWYLPTTRGIRFSVLETLRKADSIPQAAAMGVRYTINSVEDIYLTLRGLFTRDISPKGLSGPIGIAKLAYTFASVGLTHFVLFLGIISINLAVINFLPIPVLDGGHMVFLLWEGLSRKKPSEAVVATATYCGLAFVLGLFVFVIYLDIFVSKI